MAVAHDAAFESHTGTTGSTSEASFTWTHTPVGTPAGVLVFTFVVNGTGDLATSVTYGGSSLTPVSGGRAVDTVGEPGDCKAWFLGASVPTGAQAVVVNRTNNATEMYAVSITVTAGADTETTGVTLLQENGAYTEQNVNDGSPGQNSVRYAGGYYGRVSVPTIGANSTALHDIDFGSFTASVARETTAGQGSRLVGWTQAQNDDRAAVHLAVREEFVPGAGSGYYQQYYTSIVTGKL
jgi:hypothetical protein